MDDVVIPPGLCQCGCGRTTPIAQKTIGRSGYKKGDPMRYVPGHRATTRKWKSLGPPPLCECHGLEMLPRSGRAGEWKCGEAARQAARRWGMTHPERKKASYREAMWRRAGLDLKYEDFRAQVERQGNRCALCGTSDPGKTDWHADHNHQTGEFRGALCFQCNRGLGQIGDTEEALRRALHYVSGGFRENPKQEG